MPSSPSGGTDPRGARLARLIERPFAHRGLHGTGLVENSRAAFAAAIAAEMGIELDVRISRDGHAIVIHDARLDRLTEAQGRVGDHDRRELGRIRLRGSDETVPSLADALGLIAGRVPLLIELKADGRRVGRICSAVMDDLRTYAGPVAAMSFNPEVGRWFAARSPRMLRGLVVTEAGRRWRGTLARWLAVWRARPDFLAYDIRDLPSRFAAGRRAGGLKVLTWTCRSDEERGRAALHADQIIHELAP